MNIRRVALLGVILCLQSLDLTFHAVAKSSQPETVDQAMVKIVKTFRARTGKRDVPRRVSFSVNDWPHGTTQFVKVERNDTPILGEPGLTAPMLTIVAIAKSGEIFAFVGQQQMIELINPLGSGVNGTGIWYKVRLLNGTQGWLFSNAENRYQPFASFIKKKMPANGSETGISSLLILLMLLAAIFILVRKSRSHLSSSASEHSSPGDFGRSYESPNPSIAGARRSKSPSMLQDLYSPFFESSRQRAERLYEHYQAGGDEAKQAGSIGRVIHWVGDAIRPILPSPKEDQAHEAGYHGQESGKRDDRSS